MRKFLVSFLLVWFVLFLIYWFNMLFTKPENMGYVTFMFFSHMILVAVYLNKFIEEVIRK